MFCAEVPLARKEPQGCTLRQPGGRRQSAHTTFLLPSTEISPEEITRIRVLGDGSFGTGAFLLVFYLFYVFIIIIFLAQGGFVIGQTTPNCYLCLLKKSITIKKY